MNFREICWSADYLGVAFGDSLYFLTKTGKSPNSICTVRETLDVSTATHMSSLGQ